jgi:hypothetical protein
MAGRVVAGALAIYVVLLSAGGHAASGFICSGYWLPSEDGKVPAEPLSLAMTIEINGDTATTSYATGVAKVIEGEPNPNSISFKAKTWEGWLNRYSGDAHLQLTPYKPEDPGPAVGVMLKCKPANALF